jgi:hypothetical protein
MGIKLLVILSHSTGTSLALYICYYCGMDRTPQGQLLINIQGHSDSLTISLISCSWVTCHSKPSSQSQRSTRQVSVTYCCAAANLSVVAARCENSWLIYVNLDFLSGLFAVFDQRPSRLSGHFVNASWLLKFYPLFTTFSRVVLEISFIFRRQICPT